jgi:hypothetical protein
VIDSEIGSSSAIQEQNAKLFISEARSLQQQEEKCECIIISFYYIKEIIPYKFSLSK